MCLLWKLIFQWQACRSLTSVAIHSKMTSTDDPNDKQISWRVWTELKRATLITKKTPELTCCFVCGHLPHLCRCWWWWCWPLDWACQGWWWSVWGRGAGADGRGSCLKPALPLRPPTRCPRMAVGADSWSPSRSVGRHNAGACSLSPSWSAAGTAPPGRMTPRRLTCSW